MGTRGCIARATEHGFEGRYHHWDSYPSGLGANLWNLYHGHFKRDLKAMLETLIDKHPAGWSTICGKDFNLRIGFAICKSEDINKKTQKYMKPHCYCHGERKEKAWLVTQDNASGSGCEWCYAFDVEHNIMRILSSYNESGTKMIGMFGSGNEKANWVVVYEVDLNVETEPDWQYIENHVKEESNKIWNQIQAKKTEEFLHTINEGFARIKDFGLIAIPNAWYKLWYQQDVSPHLFDLDTKIAIAKRISELTLKSPIWEDKDTNYIKEFPELEPYSTTKHISGLQLCAVMEAIVEECQAEAKGE